MINLETDRLWQKVDGYIKKQVNKVFARYKVHATSDPGYVRVEIMDRMGGLSRIEEMPIIKRGAIKPGDHVLVVRYNNRPVVIGSIARDDDDIGNEEPNPTWYNRVGTSEGIGELAVIASHANTTAVGYAAKALKSSAVALGGTAEAAETLTVALGQFARATATRATAVGQAANATGIDSTALGQFTNATGVESTSLGQFSSAGGARSIAIGHNAHSSVDDQAKIKANDLIIERSDGTGVTRIRMTDANGVDYWLSISTTGNPVTTPA